MNLTCNKLDWTAMFYISELSIPTSGKVSISSSVKLCHFAGVFIKIYIYSVTIFFSVIP